MNNFKQLKEHIEKTFPKDHKKVWKVFKFAKRHHSGMTRDGGKPYIFHPIAVAENTLKFKDSKNASLLYMSALLHDCIEDTFASYKGISKKFGEDVASIVLELSTAQGALAWIHGGKAEYLSKKMINMTNYALFVKLCDRLDNISSVGECDESKRKRTISDTNYILSSLKKERKLTASQQKVVLAIEEELKKY